MMDVLRRTKIVAATLLSVRPGRECPFCGNRLWFTPVDRTATLCRRCNSLDRHRYMILFLRGSDLYDPAARHRVLHVAPEECLRDELAALPTIAYITGDLLADNVDVQRLDITEIPFEDDSFDVVICAHVFEHIPDDRLAMREVRRVLTPHGWALINGPTDPDRTSTYEDASITAPADRLEHFGQEDHVRVYSQADFVQRLEDAGFSVHVDPGTFTKHDRRRYMLGDDDGWAHTYLCSTM